MKLLWQDLPTEGRIEIGSRIRFKEGFTPFQYANTTVKLTSMHKGTVVGFLTLDHVYVQYDNVPNPSEVYPHHQRIGPDNGWVTRLDTLELI